MKRRDFIKLLGGTAALPLAARAQQGERIRRIGVLTQYREGEPAAVRNLMAFEQRLRDLGWVAGRNLAIDYRWDAGDPDLYRKLAAELVALQPDVLMTSNAFALAALREATRTIPIVFASVLDPVGGGLVESLARPGGNATGFTLFEFGITAKWLGLLKEIAPRTTRVAVIWSAGTAAGSGQLGSLQAAAGVAGVELRPIDGRDAGAIERAIAAFAQQPNGGLIMTATATATLTQQRVIAAAARHKLPAIYPTRPYVADEGGLMSYGPSQPELWRLAASYVDRILKGDKPADLPVQAPTKYELVINLKTAKALGLTVPPTLLVAADEVIE
jgi:putative ABC transport system substrate-binding protein